MRHSAATQGSRSFIIHRELVNQRDKHQTKRREGDNGGDSNQSILGTRSVATVAPFRAWRDLLSIVAREPKRVTLTGHNPRPGLSLTWQPIASYSQKIQQFSSMGEPKKCSVFRVSLGRRVSTPDPGDALPGCKLPNSRRKPVRHHQTVIAKTCDSVLNNRRAASTQTSNAAECRYSR